MQDLVKDLKIGKLYRLKRTMHTGGVEDRCAEGSILLLVSHDRPGRTWHEITFVLPGGEVRKIMFSQKNISRFLELCNSNI